MTILTALVEAVADAKNKEPAELEIVLEDHISTDAIKSLDEHHGNSWSLQFELPNHTVQIQGDETILVDGSQKEVLA